MFEGRFVTKGSGGDEEADGEWVSRKECRGQLKTKWLHRLTWLQTNITSSLGKVTTLVDQVNGINIAGLDFSLGLTVSFMVSLWLRWWNVGWTRAGVWCICSWLNSWILSVEYWMDVPAHVLNWGRVVVREVTHRSGPRAWLGMGVWHSGWANLEPASQGTCGEVEEDQVDTGHRCNEKHAGGPR